MGRTEIASNYLQGRNVYGQTCPFIIRQTGGKTRLHEENLCKLVQALRMKHEFLREKLVTYDSCAER